MLMISCCIYASRVDSVFKIGFFKWVFTSVFTVFSSCKNHGFYGFYGFYGF